MSNLSRLLQDYLKHRGNKIVFKNRVHLSQLAILMWEKLGYKEVDASVLSRVIHGERLFTPTQLKIFCRVLSLNQEEKERFTNALSQDILSRSNINTEDFIMKASGQKYNDLINILRILRKDGHPEKVISLSQLLGNAIKDKRVTGMIYNEASRAFGEISPSQTVLSLMSRLNKKAIQIGESFNDREILDMAYMNVGGAYYVAKRWKDSSMFLESKFKKVNDQTKLEFMRTLLLDYAYQRDYSKFKEALGRTIRVMNSYKNDNQTVLASIYEAIARSLSIFGFIKEARNILEEAEKISLDPFYSSQILRGYIFTFYAEKRRNVKVDNDRLNAVVEASRKTKFAPYKRHRNQIEKMIKQINSSLL